MGPLSNDRDPAWNLEFIVIFNCGGSQQHFVL